MAMRVPRQLLLFLVTAIGRSLAWSPQPKQYHIPLPTPTHSGKTKQVSLYPPDGPVVIMSGPEVRAMNESHGPHAGHPVIVALYASWCPHCWHLVPKWVNIAKAYEGQEDKIEVAAVNCADAANEDMCSDAGVTGYPFIQCFGCPVSDECPHGPHGCKVTVGFMLPPGYSIPQWMGEWVTNATKGKIQPSHPELLTEVEPGDHHVKLEGGPGKPGWVPSSYTPAEKRSKDAMRGFLTALHSKNDSAVALKAVKFMQDLFITEPCCHTGGMPNSYRTREILYLGTLASKLAGYGSKLGSPPVNAREVVEKYAADHGIHDLGSQDKFATWKEDTYSLDTDGQDSFQVCTTYTCSFWQFLHMTTTAAAYFAAAGSPRLSPHKVMEFTRFFVHEFLTCEQCRHHFLWSYDGCQFDRCDLDHQSDWTGLVLWLWRVHEGVNLRTAARDNLDVDRRWPSYEDCPGCWQSLSFDKTVVNDFDMRNIGKHPNVINEPFNLDKVYQFIVGQYVGWAAVEIGADVSQKWEVEQLLTKPKDASRVSKAVIWWTFSAVAVAGIVGTFSLWLRVKALQRPSTLIDQDMEPADACE